MSQGAVATDWHKYDGEWQRVEGAVIEENSLCLQVNGAPWFRLMCSPIDQEELAVGFLFAEGIIDGLSDIKDVYLNLAQSCVEVWLASEVVLPKDGSRTTGCGGGLTFADAESGLVPVVSDLRVDPEKLMATFNTLQTAESLYAQARGVHSAGLGTGEEILVRREDVGRHNALDKLAGHAILHGLETAGRILYSSGRISSEMLRKGVRMGCPVIASRTSPTSQSVAAAAALGVTLIGYARRGSMRVYTHAERFGVADKAG